MMYGFLPSSSSSSSSFLKGIGAFGSAFPAVGFAGALAGAAAVLAVPGGALTVKMLWHFLHLIFLPARSDGTGRRLPHCGQVTSISAMGSHPDQEGWRRNTVAGRASYNEGRIRTLDIRIRPEASPMQDSAAGGQRLLVTLATYNEHDNLRPLIAAIHEQAPQADVLVIDDNSPDGTGKLADELAAADPRMHVLHRPGKLGLGTATLAAMRYAMEHNYDLLLNLDADFSHPPRYIPQLLAGMTDRDVMIGSRYTKGGGTENWPLPRRIMSRGVNLMVRIAISHAGERRERSVPLFSRVEAAGSAAGEGEVARLLVPARSALPLPSRRGQAGRIPDHFREPPGRGVEGEHEGGGALDEHAGVAGGAFAPGAGGADSPF